MHESETKASKGVVDQGQIEAEKVGSEVYQQRHMAQIFQDGLSFSGYERNKVFLANADHSFLDVSDVSGADHVGDCRGVAIADFDGDGDPDIFTNAIQRDTHILLENQTITKSLKQNVSYLKIKLKATQLHASAIGATIKVLAGGKWQAQVLSCGNGFESQSANELVFGLGEAKSAQVKVLWPGGNLEDFSMLKANSSYLLVEKSGQAKALKQSSFSFAKPRVRGLLVSTGDSLDQLKVGTEGGQAEFLSKLLAPSLLAPSLLAPSLLAPKLSTDKKVLLNFWSLYCSPCREELGLLQELEDSGRFVVVSVCLDSLSISPKIDKLWKSKKLNFQNYFADPASTASVLEASVPIPVSMILNSDMKIETIIQGKLPKGEL